jgi:hypothetical protein
LPAPTTTNNHPQASETTDILANRLNLKCYAHHVNIQILSTRPASYRGSTLRTIVVNRCVLRDLRQTVGLLVGTTYQVARTTANHHIEDSCRVRFSPKSTTTGVGYPDRGPSTPLPTEDLTRPTFCFAVKYRVDQKAIGTPTLVKVNIVVAIEGGWGFSSTGPLPSVAQRSRLL